VSVHGERLNGDLTFSTELRFPDESEANDFIPRLWASRKLGHLERQVWTEGMSEHLAAEIREVALRYGLPSRFTSYLVQEPNVVATAPVDLGRSGPLPGRPVRTMSNGNAASPAPTTGAGAVQAAASARSRRDMASMDELQAADADVEAEMLAKTSGTGQRSAVGGRVFELRNDVWTDVSWEVGAKTVRVKRFSAAWFDLVRALPEVEAPLRLHENVVIAGEKLSLQIGDDGVASFETTELRGIVDGFRGPAER
jgi:Ca-activated chloride channel family protein